MIAEATPNVVWKCIPGINGLPSSQGLAISCPANIIFFDGPRGCAKTASQIMYFRQFVGLGYGKYCKGLIIDQEAGDLDDLVSQSERELYKFDDGARFNRSKGDYRWIWPTGEELLFRAFKSALDYRKIHGHEYFFIGVNEAAKMPVRDLYDLLFSVNRCGFDPEMHTPKNADGTYRTRDGKPLPKPKPTMFLTTNPFGPGHNWLKREFVDPAEPGEIVYKTHIVHDTLRNEYREVTLSQVRIFGNFYENPYISDSYRAQIIESCKRNKNLKAAWVFGDWSVSSGGALDDLWDDQIHVINRFRIPDNWTVDRSMDWGSATPYAVIWWAEANGEEFEKLNGEIWAPPAGTLFGIFEEYSAPSSDSNKGNRRSARDVARDILEREQMLLRQKWIGTTPMPGPADNSIASRLDEAQQSVETIMLNEKVLWLKSDKSKGSRENGLIAIRDRLEASLSGEGPGVYFFRNCVNSIETIRTIPIDDKNPDDVNTDGTDHCYDTMRYKCYEMEKRVPVNLKVSWVR